MGSSRLISLSGGTTVDLAVLERLWTIEARGAIFTLTAQGFDIAPDGILTHADRAFLLAHLEDARRVVRYGADDAHLKAGQLY